MQWLIFPLVSITSWIIFYQDLKSRSVTWLLFPAFAVGGVFYSIYNSESILISVKNSLINVGFLTFQYLVLRIVFYMINNNRGEQKTKSIALGDVLLLVGCALFFSPINFIIFFILSLLFSLLLHVFLKVIFTTKNYQATIPLAGFQALFLSIYIILNEIFNNNLTNDDHLLFYMTTA